MTTNEIMKMVTDAMKSNGADAEQIAKVEMAIQYCGNPEFREKLETYVFNAAYADQRTQQSIPAKALPN